MVRRLAIGVAIGLVLLLVVDAIAARLGLAPGVLPTVAGPSPWVTSRAAGVTAFLALTLDVVFGLLVSTGAGDHLVPRARSVELHRWLSSVALALVGVHAVALTADRFVRFDLLDLIVPFVGPGGIAVGLGVLAAYAAIVVHVSFGLRRRIGTRAWRSLHYLSFAVFGAALVHGLLAGSDRSAAGMQALYVAAISVVAALGLYRVSRAARAA